MIAKPLIGFRRCGFGGALASVVVGLFLSGSAYCGLDFAMPSSGTAAVAEARHPWEKPRTATAPAEIGIDEIVSVDIRSPEFWFKELVDRQLLDDPREIKDKTLLELLDQKKKQAEQLAEPAKTRMNQDTERWWLQIQNNRWRNQVEEWLATMCLFIDRKPIQDLLPESIYSWEEYEKGELGKFERYYSLQFRLRKTEANRETWFELLRGWGVFDRPSTISVGLLHDRSGNRVMEMPTEVSVTASKPYQRFKLETAPNKKLVASLFLGLVIAGLLFWLAVESNLLRDTSGQRHPDGRYPYSLGLCQLAFWTVLVAMAWLFLWVITGEYNTITNSELTLIGISATTGLGALLINQAAPSPKPTALTSEDLTLKPEEIKKARETAEEDVVSKQKNLAEKRAATLAARAAVVANSSPQAAADAAAGSEKQAEEELALAEQRAAELRDREDFFKKTGRLRAFCLDLLRERRTVSLHRFQMLAWTILMGLVFLFGVLFQLAMPKFEATLLLLLGISNGTYLSFKWPEAKRGSE